jgi:hypothetical protein
VKVWLRAKEDFAGVNPLVFSGPSPILFHYP